MVFLELLGPVRLICDGVAVAGLRTRKAVVLLAYLLVRRAPQSRAAVADLFWPDLPEAAGRAELTRVVHDLRRRLGDVIASDRRHLGLALTVDSDVSRVDRATRSSSPADWSAAVEGYRGPFLDGFQFDDAEMSAWADAERAVQHQRVAGLLSRLTDTAQATGDDRAALRWARRWVDHDRFDELAQRCVIRLLARCGQPNAALAHLAAFSQDLRHELGVEVHPDTTELGRQVRSGVIEVVPTLPDLPSPPAATSPLIGADVTLDLVSRLIADPEVRALTLTGAGGVGKTRLAQEAAWLAVAQGAAAAAVWVELSAVTETDLVMSTIAAALGLDPGLEARTAVVRVLSGRQVLLVLDNVEQIAGGGRVVADLLGALPRLTVVMTSRGPVRVRGEHLVSVPPLDASPSVALFVQRAVAARADFDPDAQPDVVRQVCARLDGLPLALELAAAQLRLLDITAVLTRLGRRLDALRADEDDRPTRHRTLRTTVSWSLQLLDEPRQRLFAELGVYVGGVEQGTVAPLLPPGSDPLAALGDLVDAGLLHRVPGSCARFRMLSTISDVAVDQLAEIGIEQAARDRHAATFLDLARAGQRPGRDSDGRGQLDRLEVVARELENVRAALAHVAATSPPAALSQWCLALETFWWIRYDPEAAAWLDAALAGREQLPPHTVGRLLISAAYVAQLASQLDRSDQYVDELEPMALALPDTELYVQVLLLRGSNRLFRGDVATFAAFVAQAKDLALEGGHRRELLTATMSVSGLAAADPDLDRVQALSDETLALSDELQDVLWRANILGNAAAVAVRAGDDARAATCLAESLRLDHRRGAGPTSQYDVTACAGLAHRMGRTIEAAQLLGVVDTLLAISGEPTVPSLLDVRVQLQQDVVTTLGPAEAERQREVGRHSDFQLAITVADALVAAAAPAPPA